MRYSYPMAALALLVTACHPDAPATEAGRPPVATTPAPAAAAPPAVAGHPADTLHLPGGQVVRLQPSTAAAFNQLPADTVADPYSTDPEPIDLRQLRVRRRGLDLRLQPTAGPLVVLHSVPDQQFTLQNDAAVRYQYLGSLPGVHQLVVRASSYDGHAFP